jgi:predicted transcriptional regulator
MSTTMTIRLEDEVKDGLERLAESTQRSKSFWLQKRRARTARGRS